METPTALVIGQLAAYMRELTRRLDPAAGWYGEFLRRDPEGMRACLDGVAMPPWDVLESLLGDLPGDPGDTAREAVYAAGLRAAAVAAWDAVPGGDRELRTLLDAAAGERAAAEAALRGLTRRLDAAADPEEAAALSRELAWTRDDAARAAARQADLTARLRALPHPLPAVPSQRRPHDQPPPAEPTSQTPLPAADGAWAQPVRSGVGDLFSGSGEPGIGDPLPGAGGGPGPGGREPGAGAGGVPASAGPAGPGPAAAERTPVGRAEGRWLRGARRSGGARYAGRPQPGADRPGPAPVPEAPLPPPRGARFAGRAGASAPAPDAPRREAAAGPAGAPARPDGVPGPTGAGPRPGFIAELVALRERGRTGEAHALLCEAAAWPAAHLPALADGLARAGLAADWATLLWEAASLPPERLAAAAAALGAAGRDADRDGLLRQGVARPAVEVAEAALALAAAGRDREVDALLGAFVRLRTAEEAAALARRDPHWFAPRLLAQARAVPGTRHRDLAHALRVAGVPAS